MSAAFGIELFIEQRVKHHTGIRDDREMFRPFSVYQENVYGQWMWEEVKKLIDFPFCLLMQSDRRVLHITHKGLGQHCKSREVTGVWLKGPAWDNSGLWSLLLPTGGVKPSQKCAVFSWFMVHLFTFSNENIIPWMIGTDQLRSCQHHMQGSPEPGPCFLWRILMPPWSFHYQLIYLTILSPKKISNESGNNN